MKKFLPLFTLLLGLFGCSGATPTPTPTVREVQVVLVNSEISTGLARFAVALFDTDNQFVHDATVDFQYFDLSDAQEPEFESDATAVHRQSSDRFTSIYTHLREFERAGSWGLQVNATFTDGSVAQQGIAFQVLEDGEAFSVGVVAPPVDTPKASEYENDLSLISSALEPEPAFYELSLRDALENDKPTLVYFSTPAFCQTRLCGPGYEELVDFHDEAGDQYNIIHVEVFTGLPNPGEAGWPLAPAMVAFGLTTEPWLFVMDETGEVVLQLEGLFTAVELEETLPELLQ